MIGNDMKRARSRASAEAESAKDKVLCGTTALAGLGAGLVMGAGQGISTVAHMAKDGTLTEEIKERFFLGVDSALDEVGEGAKMIV